MKDYIIPVDKNYAKKITQLCREVHPVCCSHNCNKKISKEYDVFTINISGENTPNEQINELATLCERCYIKYTNYKRDTWKNRFQLLASIKALR